MQQIEKDSKKIIRRLQQEGWEIASQRGSHVKLKNGNRTVIVPHPKKDLPEGTARNIAKAAGWI
jgi:predicted RNA binding protein YcfA (HicA-like mRNA interferase family)